MSPLVLFFSHHLQVSGDELGLLGGVLLLRTSPACGRTHPGTAQYTEGHTLCWSTCLQLQALILTSGIRYGCYMMLCWFCYVLFIFSPWISLIFPKIYLVYFNWWMHCCWNGLNVEYVEWPPTESLAPRNMLAKSRQNYFEQLNSPLYRNAPNHPCTGNLPTLQWFWKTFACWSLKQNGTNGRKSWCSWCSCGSLGSGDWSLLKTSRPPSRHPLCLPDAGNPSLMLQLWMTPWPKFVAPRAWNFDHSSYA